MMRQSLRAARVLRARSLPYTSAPYVRALATATANPLLECVRERKLPPFERLQIADIKPAVETAASEYTRDLRALEERLEQQRSAQLQWRDVVEPLEVQSDPLERIWGIVGHLMSVRNSEPLRTVHDELQQLVIETFTEASQSKALYNAYQAVHESAEWDSLSLAQQVRVCSTLDAIASADSVCRDDCVWLIHQLTHCSSLRPTTRLHSVSLS